MIVVDSNFDASQLTFSKLVEGKSRFGNQQIFSPHWIQLHHAALRDGFEYLSARRSDLRAVVRELSDLTGSKIAIGDKYAPISGTPLSVQGQDAPDIWRCSQRIADLVDVDIELTVIWGRHAAAAHPGEVRVLRYQPLLRQLLA